MKNTFGLWLMLTTACVVVAALSIPFLANPVRPVVCVLFLLLAVLAGYRAVQAREGRR